MPGAERAQRRLLFAALCIGLGVYFEPLYALLPFATVYVPYTGSHVVVQLELLLFSGLAFFVMLPMLRRTLTITLDTDWIYRRFAPVLVRGVEALAGMGGSAVRAWTLGGAGRVRALVHRFHGVEGVLARTSSTGGMALWVAVLLAAYLAVYYL